MSVKRETPNKVAKKENVQSKFVAYVSLQKNECGKEVKIFEKNGRKSWRKRKAFKSEEDDRIYVLFYKRIN